MNAQFRHAVSVGEELAAVILASWTKDHPGDDAPVQATELPWGAEVVTDDDCAIVDVPMEPAVKILVEGVALEYKAGVVEGAAGVALFYSVRRVPGRKRK